MHPARTPKKGAFIEGIMHRLENFFAICILFTTVILLSNCGGVSSGRSGNSGTTSSGGGSGSGSGDGSGSDGGSGSGESGSGQRVLCSGEGIGASVQPAASWLY